MDNATPILSRPFDALVAGILLLAFSPLMLVIAFAIRWDSRGSPMFTQLRLGRGCKPFSIHKFRTMTAPSNDPGAVAPRGDERVTRVGHWLRRFRLDELPQLLDVLSGRMALVGPRPEVSSNLEAVGAHELERLLSVRPGMTGPTQLDFIAEDELLAEFDDPGQVYRQILVPAKVRRDLIWLRSRSLLTDLRVLLRTPGSLASRRAWARSRAVVKGVLKEAVEGPGFRIRPRGSAN